MIKIGDTFTSDNGSTAVVIGYVNNKNIEIQYPHGLTQVVQGSNLLKGSFKDPMKPSYKGIGILGTSKPRASDQSYVAWSNMLRRVYFPKDGCEAVAYKDCSVCEEWLVYVNFKNWFDSQTYSKGFHLDKDLLCKGNKVYSPLTCVFIPQEINKFMTCRKNKRGDLPLGVSYKKSNLKYDAKISINSRSVHIGLFDDPTEAFYAYKKVKEQYAQDLANKWKYHIDEKAYTALLMYEVDTTD